jgi:hypothetical protein
MGKLYHFCLFVVYGKIGYMRITKGKVFFLIILTIAVLWLASVAIKSYKPNPISGGILEVGTSAVAPLQVGDGVISKETMDNGLIIEVLKEGTGAESKQGDTVTVHYTGTFTDGTVFDSSVTRGEPFAFTLGGNRVIQGWEQGVLGMKEGEKRRLTVHIHWDTEKQLTDRFLPNQH